ncbi:A disintegrin and metalloproteinase with thrombospondin motifs 6-like isoform X2 [Cherax quadricarinatus]|uniref:A disintegrin and metalloproteinase with thrombospondin motifs 6-like isoform X2 n=1 Tax=Cherax quadricarinatus TaxID=27406 RepID=UPI002378AD92|nr:A disintegrin and metalloproteinase with thrombospondin motifs 6-like isoform X2 [Cherax quadricarinatus]
MLTHQLNIMSVSTWILLFSIFASLVTGMQIHLADTGQPLDPHLEAVAFPIHKPREYQVLRWSSRERRSLRNLNNSSVTLRLPFKDSRLDLILDKVNLAAPDLELSFHDLPNKKLSSVQLDCFYAGGNSTTWAVISTCSHLMGVVARAGENYQVEEVDQPGQRHRRGVRDTLVVLYPLRSPLPQDTAQPPFPPDFDDEFDVNTPETQLDRTSSALGDLTTSSDTSETPGGRGGRVRRRTRKDSSYTVELAVFVDRPLYSYVRKRYPNHNTDDKVVEIVMTLINAVHRLYSDSSLGDVKIGLLVKRVEVLAKGEPHSAKGDIFKYLKNFCKWQSNINPQNTPRSWDHALLLSGDDLWNAVPSKNTTVGLAYVGGMCSRSYSCTVNEATSLTAAYIIAHEMGHNLNMRHDGSGSASHCRRNEFIMSPVMSSGATTWSSCSRDSLQAFLLSRGHCLDSSSTHMVSVDGKNHEGKAPGRRFNADEQCHYMYGNGWRHFYSSQEPFNNVCREIWCRKGRYLKTPSAAALEGTSCGAAKIS